MKCFLCRDEASTTVTLVIFFAMMLISLVLNTLIVVVIRKTKEFRHSQYVYKASIAVSDIIWSLCFCILSGYGGYTSSNTFVVCQRPNTSSNNFTNSTVVYVSCELITNIPVRISSLVVFLAVFIVVIAFLTTISLTVSFVSLIFAAVDRYCALAYPLRYRATNTIKVAKISTAFIWILSTFLNVFTTVYSIIKNKAITSMFQPLPIHKELSFFTQSPNQDFVSVLLFALFSLLWLFTILTLISVYKAYKTSLKLNRSVKTKIAAEKQMSLVLIAMVVAFTFSLFPTLLNHILLHVNKSEFLKSTYKAYVKLSIAFSFLMTNSIWNILVYNVLNKQFRAAFKALFKKNN